MSFLVLASTFVAAFLFILFKKARAAALALGFGGSVLLLVGQGWVPKLLLERLQDRPQLLTPEWKDHNVIVVLGIGTVRWPESDRLTTHALGYSRLHEGARLYRQCKSAGKLCTVISSGGDPRKNGRSEAEVMRDELTEIGIPDGDALVESKSNNTFQNAQFTSEIIAGTKPDFVVLVTSGIHLKRSLLYFNHFGVRASGAPSDRLEAISGWMPLAHNFSFTDLALHEVAGFARFGIYNVMGWNAGSGSAGTP